MYSFLNGPAYIFLLDLKSAPDLGVVQKYNFDALILLLWKMLNFEPEIDYSDGEIADHLSEKREGLKKTKNYKPDAEASGA